MTARRATCAIALVAGCSGSPDRGTAANGGAVPIPAAADAGPPVITPPGYHLPSAAALPAYTVECADLGTPVRATPRSLYDLGTIALPAVETGARIAERPRRLVGRSPLPAAARLAETPELAACWKWASAKLGLGATAATISLRIDPWGRVHDADASGPEPKYADLFTCLEDVVAGVTFPGTTTRWTHATIALELGLVAQPKWKKKPPRPARPTPEARGQRCTPVETSAPDDEVPVVSPIALTDHDPSRDKRRKRVALVPRVGLSYGVELPRAYSTDERLALQRDVRSNLGALSACHASARDRDPALAGVIDARWQVDASGVADAVTIEGAGDDALHDCLRAALAEIWFPHGSDAPLALAQRFTVSPPPTISGTGHDAALALLYHRDVDGALDRWEALLAADPDGDQACDWRVGVLRAMTERTPWLDDARLDAALDDLVAHAAAIQPGRGAQCLVLAWPTIAALLGPLEADWPNEVFVTSWRERLALLDRLAPVTDRLDDGRRVEIFRAIGLSLSDPRAALVRLRELESRDDLGLVAMDEADRLAALIVRLDAAP